MVGLLYSESIETGSIVRESPGRQHTEGFVRISCGAAPQGYAAITQAQALAAGVTEKERRLIDALAKRYSRDPQADRVPLDQAYADAMGALTAAYPADFDIATLYAASLMNLSPWDYWYADGTPKDPATAEQFVGLNAMPAMLAITEEILSAEIAAERGRHDEAISRLARAVRLEDSLTYNQPPDWYFPVRRYLGAALLDAGFPAEAEVVYWQDLAKNRENGFPLFGLQQALEAQDRVDEAAAIRTRFDLAWAEADTELTSSRF